MKKLDVPLLNQPKGSPHCSLVCCQMIMHYYGEKVSYEQLVAEMSEYINDTGMDSQAVPIYLASHGYDTTWIVRDLDVVDKSIDEMIDETRLSELEAYFESISEDEENHYRKRKTKLDIEVIKAGARYSNKTPSPKLLEDAIDEGKPVIVSLRGNSIHPYPLKHNNHSILLTGYNDYEYYINDPGWEFEKPYSVSKNKLIMGWYMTAARTIISSK